MINKIKNSEIDQKNIDDFNDKCEECNREDETVSKNLILTGFKLCESCKISKTIFPI